jgi:amino acid adenylation domain-containing protein
VQGYRLSPQQKRLWELGAENPAFQAWTVLEWAGGIRLERLDAAIARVVARHDILRTTFRRPPTMQVGVQVVADRADVRVSRPGIALSDWLGAPRQVDLAHAPMLEVTLLDTESAGCARVGLRLSSLGADWHSLSLLADEVVRFYHEEEFSEEVLQFPHVAAWQNDLLEGDESPEGGSFWRSWTVEAAADLVLPHERLAAASAFAPHTIEIGEIGLDRLQDAAARHCASVPALLLASWQCLLWRLTGVSDAVLAEMADGREYADLRRVVGPCAKWLPMRYRFTPDARVRDVVLHTERTRAETRQWQECFVWPAGNVPIGYEYLVRSPLRAAGPVQCVAQGACHDIYRVKLTCIERDRRVCLGLHYAAAAFEEAAIARLGEQLRTLLDDALARPEVAVQELRVIGPAERALLVEQWGAGQRQAIPSRMVYEDIETHATQSPDAVALVDQLTTLTYAELNGRANQLARVLRAEGVGGEQVVAVALERSAAHVVCLLGVLKAGAVYLPLDVEQPPARLRALVGGSGARLVLTDARVAAELATDASVMCVDWDWPRMAAESPLAVTTRIDPRQLAYVIYTSGSAGTPKGVAIEHRQLSQYVEAIVARLQLEPNSRYALVSTVAADLGHTVLFPSLCTGATLHIVSNEMAMDGSALHDYVACRQIDCLKIVPSHLQALQDDDGRIRAIPTRRLVLGGDVLRSDLVERIRASRPQCSIMNHYGPTETTVGVLTNDVTGAPQGPHVPLGGPLGNVQAYVLDEQQELCAAGVAGELYIGGASVSRGYLGQPGWTAERFVPDAFGRERGSRLYRTGDRARWTVGGALEFLGRLDNQVKLRGHRVELGEIEVAIRRVPSVRDAVVVVREERGERQLVGYWQREAGSTIAAEDVRHALADRLPAVMVPTAWMEVARWPLTRNGKIDRRQLPAPDAAASGAVMVGPRTPVEEVLAELWSEVLGHRGLSVEANFFQLGGHSLMATRLMSRVREAFGVTIPLRRLFKSPTIAGLAQALVEAWEDPAAVHEIAQLHLDARRAPQDAVATVSASFGE